MKSYNTNDIYVACVGPVYINKKNEISIDKKRLFYTLVINNEKKYGDSYYSFIDEKEYKYFENVSYNFVIKRMDKCYISELTPLNVYLKETREISLKELYIIYRNLNDKEKTREIEDNDKEIINNQEEIKDHFLKLLIKTREKISPKMKREVQKKFIEELEALGTLYADMLTKLIDQNMLENKLKVVIKCMPKLVDIELRINEYNQKGIPKDNLSNDVKTFKKKLGVKYE